MYFLKSRLRGLIHTGFFAQAEGTRQNLFWCSRSASLGRSIVSRHVVHRANMSVSVTTALIGHAESCRHVRDKAAL